MPDIKELIGKFTEDKQQRLKENEKALAEGIYRDYVPPNVGIRICAAIRMSIRMEGFCPNIIVNEKTNTSMMLDEKTEQVIESFSRKAR